MDNYSDQTPLLLAVDGIVFGFDGQQLKLLLIKREFEPEKGKWSLMGGFVSPDEGINQAAQRVLEELTGLKDIYLEQLHAYGRPDRDPSTRTVSITYFALINLMQFNAPLSERYQAEWFPMDKLPELIFDHEEMIEDAKTRLRYKAALHPILFELLPEKFTIPQLQNLYEQVYQTNIDNRNFTKKLSATKILIRLQEKDKSASRKGAFYYRLDREHYLAGFQNMLNFIPNRDKLV